MIDYVVTRAQQIPGSMLALGIVLLMLMALLAVALVAGARRDQAEADYAPEMLRADGTPRWPDEPAAPRPRLVTESRRALYGWELEQRRQRQTRRGGANSPHAARRRIAGCGPRPSASIVIPIRRAVQ